MLISRSSRLAVTGLLFAFALSGCSRNDDSIDCQIAFTANPLFLQASDQSHTAAESALTKSDKDMQAAVSSQSEAPAPFSLDDWITALADDFNSEFQSPSWVENKPPIFVTFDEDSDTLSVGSGNEGNHIFFAAIPNAAAIKNGFNNFDFYSLQRDLEDRLRRVPDAIDP